ncbi:MBL fold metallo-hydrolase [Alteromonas gracilis]|uniref:MBL fold metallo-hydrolase n=1 Tax=Alteromonas gracilis TaxID=1479524 RepID=UPI0030CDE17A
MLAYRRTSFFIGVLFMTSFCGCSNAIAENAPLPEKFSNTHITYQTSLGDMWKVLKAYWRDNRKAATPTFEIPVVPLDIDKLDAVEEDSIVKLGHSTTLIKVKGEYILIDPVFSERASPVQWMGPKRFHASPINVEALPELAAVIISHDHYDHLDKGSIEILKHKTKQFVMPLKVGNHLRDWGVENSKITELDWWQKTILSGIEIVATPSQHFSGRGLFDRDETLWASWVIRSTTTNVFYSGDSGYFDGFKDIGEKYGPFDLSLIETGAYNELWSDIHMLPHQCLKAHIDVQASVMMPVHNSTFDLALHNWNEPLVKITALAEKQRVPMSTPIFGEIIPIANAAEAPNKTWWLE